MSASEGSSGLKEAAPGTAKAWRRHMSYPGALAPAVQRRWEEFGYRTFSPYAVELVCFDLRTRCEHYVTLRFARDTPAAQDAIDRTLARHYRPGEARDGALIRRLLEQAADEGREQAATSGALVSERKWVFFPGRLRELIEARWQELGYDGLSTYVTGLIRYDLILGGPHRHFTAADMHPELLAALDAETIRRFHSKRKRKIRLEYLIEAIEGRAMESEERLERIQEIAPRLREFAMRPGRRPRG